MKKADLRVGMRVENKSGGVGTVLDKGGWRKANTWSHRAPDVHPGPDGCTFLTDSRRDTSGPGIIVAWDYANRDLPEGEPLRTSTMQTRDLLPIGSAELRRLDREANEAKRKAYVAAQNKAASDLAERVRALLGDHADELFAKWYVVQYPDGSWSDRSSILRAVEDALLAVQSDRVLIDQQV